MKYVTITDLSLSNCSDQKTTENITIKEFCKKKKLKLYNHSQLNQLIEELN